jgi:hypothetical protein
VIVPFLDFVLGDALGAEDLLNHRCCDGSLWVFHRCVGIAMKDDNDDDDVAGNAHDTLAVAVAATSPRPRLWDILCFTYAAVPREESR